jgi:DNA polymerase III subunit epsilon
MMLATHYLQGLPARSLSACCEAARIELSDHHSALCDAQAAAGLLARFRTAHVQLPNSWRAALVQAAAAPWVPAPQAAGFSPVTRAQQVMRRQQLRAPLANLVNGLPRGPEGGLDSYLGVLDRVLEDRMVSDDELVTLSDLAIELGLTRDGAERAHRQYLEHVSAAAWRDMKVTEEEQADLLEVARLLDVPGDEALAILDHARDNQCQPADHHTVGLCPGDRVVFTGDMKTDRSEIEALATAAGLRVTTAVSGKTALVVAADPYSQSGKARVARQRGVRVVTEQVFLHLLDNLRPAGETISSTRP